jgi:hypothetical protein
MFLSNDSHCNYFATLPQDATNLSRMLGKPKTAIFSSAGAPKFSESITE